MPRHVRVRVTRPRPAVDLDEAVLASLIEGELPEWLAAFLLDRDDPPRGTADDRLLQRLQVDPVTGSPHIGLLHRSPLAAVWKAHKGELMARWRDGGRKGRPWAATLEIDPYDPDPRDALFERTRH